MDKLPRIASVGVGAEIYPGRRAVVVGWTGRPALSSEVDLSGWIATGGEILAPLRDYALFETASVTDDGRAIVWGDPDGDLAIDAVHLGALAEEQSPLTAADLAAWQERFDLSNAEAAGVLDVGRSTYLAYKASGEGAPLPRAIAIAVRASLRDPLVLQAHLRPMAPAGRPRSPV